MQLTKQSKLVFRDNLSIELRGALEIISNTLQIFAVRKICERYNLSVYKWKCIEHLNECERLTNCSKFKMSHNTVCTHSYIHSIVVVCNRFILK